MMVKLLLRVNAEKLLWLGLFWVQSHQALSTIVLGIYI